MTRTLFVFLLMASVFTASAQTFSINVVFDNAVAGKVTLTIYCPDKEPQTVSRKVSRGSVSFSGQVSQPCYAEVCTARGQKLGLFVENTEINVHFNVEEPEASQVTGSRVNSQYRYALEQCREADGSYNVASLAAQVSENRSALFAPLLIYRYLLPRCDIQRVRELMDDLEGEATKTHHYKLLAAIVTGGPPVLDGMMPDITFADCRRQVLHTDSLLNDSTYNLIIVGATWCNQCSNAKTEALRQDDRLNIIVINIDDDKRLWDADVVKKLDIDHIPYLILLSSDRTVLAQDIRPWEIARVIDRLVNGIPQDGL